MRYLHTVKTMRNHLGMMPASFFPPLPERDCDFVAPIPGPFGRFLKWLNKLAKMLRQMAILRELRKLNARGSCGPEFF